VTGGRERRNLLVVDLGDVGRMASPAGDVSLVLDVRFRGPGKSTLSVEE
jgi:hypothetical protein